jgi:hypothetical protein
MKPARHASVPEGRPRGRPRGTGRSWVTEPRATVSTWLPAGAHDKLIALAKREDRSVSETVKRLIILRLE